MPAQFHFYGGKGGVGKTTCAAAHAIAAARSGSRVLIVSTDPAHSLGDALNVRLSARASRLQVGGIGSSTRRRAALHAVELDAPRAFRRWLARHRAALGDVVEHGTWLDRDDVEALLELPVPGLDELAGLLEIVRLSSSRYDVIVVDTAPTGHTLRLLAAPETLASVAEVLDLLQQEHRRIREQLARLRRPEAADHLVALLAEQAVDTRALLRQPDRTFMHWVMLPEELSLAETRDALTALGGWRIPVQSLVINRLTPDGPACRICSPRRREERRVAAHAINLARPAAPTASRRGERIATPRVVRMIPATATEPRGVGALVRLGKYLTSPPVAPNARSLPTATKSRPFPSPGRRRFSIALPGNARLLFVGGKGGVGKTTVAAGLALRIARADPDQRVLLLSTDPAHSLGDVFERDLGDRPQAVRGGPLNLHVRELDAPRALIDRRRELQSAFEEIAGAVGAAALVTGEAAAAQLLELAPPGIDELLGLVSIFESSSAAADVIVIDTAPTGHALRLLEMPDTARAWLQTILRMLLKYRELVRPGRLAAELVELSRSIGALQQLFRNPRQAHFIVVTRAAALPRLETVRLFDRLRALQLDVPMLVVNAVTGAPGRCPQCRRTASAEQRELALIGQVWRRRAGDCAIIQTPLIEPPPRGVAALDRWTEDWTLIR